MFTNTQYSFQTSTWTIANDIGSDVLTVDTASGGYGLYNAFSNFPGSVSILDQTPGTAGGRTAGSTEWTLDFITSTYTIGTVGANLTFSSNTCRAFKDSTMNVAQVGGTARVESTSSGGQDFYNTDFTIHGAQSVVFDVDCFGGEALRYSETISARTSRRFASTSRAGRFRCTRPSGTVTIADALSSTASTTPTAEEP